MSVHDRVGYANRVQLKKAVDRYVRCSKIASMDGKCALDSFVQFVSTESSYV